MSNEDWPDPTIQKGNVEMTVMVWKNKVRLEFPMGFSWIALRPVDARELANQMLRTADVCDALEEQRSLPLSDVS